MSKVKFTTTLDDKLIKKAKIEAINLEISAASLIEKLLIEYFEKKETREKS